MKRSGHVKSLDTRAFFGKTFHKGMGELVFAGLLYYFTSLKFHYLPHDMDKILFPSGELKEREFENEAIEKEII